MRGSRRDLVAGPDFKHRYSSSQQATFPCHKIILNQSVTYSSCGEQCIVNRLTPSTDLEQRWGDSTSHGEHGLRFLRTRFRGNGEFVFAPASNSDYCANPDSQTPRPGVSRRPRTPKGGERSNLPGDCEDSTIRFEWIAPSDPKPRSQRSR